QRSPREYTVGFRCARAALRYRRNRSNRYHAPSEAKAHRYHPPMPNARPTREELDAAYGRALKPVIAPGLRMLLCGINPSLYSAAVGHHFAGPSNRFWKVLHQSGITPRLLTYAED